MPNRRTGTAAAATSAARRKTCGAVRSVEQHPARGEADDLERTDGDVHRRPGQREALRRHDLAQQPPAHAGADGDDVRGAEHEQQRVVVPSTGIVCRASERAVDRARRSVSARRGGLASAADIRVVAPSDLGHRRPEHRHAPSAGPNRSRGGRRWRGPGSTSSRPPSTARCWSTARGTPAGEQRPIGQHASRLARACPPTHEFRLGSKRG